MTPEDQRQLAKDLFNGTWELLEKRDRSAAEDDRMLHMAHASRFHWGEVGTAENLTRGEWQVSRVYCVLGRGEPARYHARRSLELTEQAGFDGFALAFALEASARADAVAGDLDSARAHVERALAVPIADDEERSLLHGDLETIPGLDRFW